MNTIRYKMLDPDPLASFEDFFKPKFSCNGVGCTAKVSLKDLREHARKIHHAKVWWVAPTGIPGLDQVFGNVV